jgi:amidase
MPIGMQIMARRLRDDRALAAAAAYEALCPASFRMPEVDTTWRKTSQVETTTTGYTIAK